MKQDGNAKRYNTGKTKLNLIPPYAREELGRALQVGYNKYGIDNWKKGFKWGDVVDSLERHLNAFKWGEDEDPETGVLHIAAVTANAMFLTEFYRMYPQGDDRWVYYHPKIGLDIDEVLADFIGGWMELHGMTNRPTAWDFHRDMDEAFVQLKESGGLEEFYMNLKPLVDPTTIPFEPECYITSRPVSTDISQKWLDMHGFPVKPVHTVGYGKSKVDIAKEVGLDIFVDDAYKNFRELNEAGIFCYLMDASHNQRYTQVGHRRLYNLSDLQYIHKQPKTL